VGWEAGGVPAGERLGASGAADAAKLVAPPPAPPDAPKGAGVWSSFPDPEVRQSVTGAAWFG